MSDFDEYATPEAGGSPPLPPLPESGGQSTSGLAVGSFVLALIGICGGVTAVIALPLGIIAMIVIRGKPNVKGFGLALTGVIISAVLIPAWIGLGYVGFKLATSLTDLQPGVQKMTDELVVALESNDVDGALKVFAADSHDTVRRDLAALAAERGPFKSVVAPAPEVWMQQIVGTGDEQIECSVPLTVTWNDGSTGILRVLFGLTFKDFRFALDGDLPFRGIDVSFDASAGAGSGD